MDFPVDACAINEAYKASFDLYGLNTPSVMCTFLHLTNANTFARIGSLYPGLFYQKTTLVPKRVSDMYPNRPDHIHASRTFLSQSEM